MMNAICWSVCKLTCLFSKKRHKIVKGLYGLLNPSFVYYSSQLCSSKNKLLIYLKHKIEATGPITVAEYMKEVLTNPYAGYYMHQDVFGSAGDFITSPEISQIFGELIAVWYYNEWCRLQQPHPLQLVELGPGRGTLADDILRVFSKLNSSGKALSLHLVEVSPHLRELQMLKLCNGSSSVSGKSVCSQHSSNDNFYRFSSDKEFMTKYGIPVTWHYDLETVPNSFSLLLAHEFFDALPIHKFQRTPAGWREILIDCKSNDKGAHLQFVLSKSSTPASKVFIDSEEKRSEVEVSPESVILIEKIASRMEQFGGISLIIDYGYVNNEKSDTFRGFQKHKLHDPLVDPGFADLTADVDFSRLIKHLRNKAVEIGPVTQSTFLQNMGIDVRLEKLLQNASPEEQEALKSGYKMLLDSKQMGERYKFLAFYPAVLKEFLSKYPPPGFS